MSHEEGAYLGGIRTVECLRQRSRVDADTGCWHWSLNVDKAAARVHFVTPDTGQRVCMRGRRAALYLLRGHDVRKGYVAFSSSKCSSHDCVNPAHCVSGNRQAHGAWVKRSGIAAGLPSKIAAARKTWDTRGRTLTPEMVLEIRASTETTYAMAKRLGVAQFTVWSARVGNSHKHVFLPASVFNWMPPKGSPLFKDRA
jgi:hypothetical protein